MKWIGILAVVAAAAIVLWTRHHSAPASTPAAARIDRVTKLASLDERRALGTRIAAAQAARASTTTASSRTAGRTPTESRGPAATRAPSPPRLPDAEPAISASTLRGAMRELIPTLAECFEKHEDALPAEVSLTASLHLSGDPEVGTLIDADALVDDAGKPLPAAFDDCLRSTFMLMALPPLAEGDHIEVHYPFKFARN